MMLAGIAQVIVGTISGTAVTSMVTLALTGAYASGSAGAKLTESVCPDPTGRMVPAGGSYVRVPRASTKAFNCVPPSAVPCRMLAGVAQVMVGVTRPGGVNSSADSLLMTGAFELHWICWPVAT